MPKKILVAYGTRYDSTEKVAMKLAERIITHGHSADLKNLQISAADYIASYDGIIVGTGIKKAGWTSEIDNFLKDNKTQLQNKPFGFFICSGHSAEEKNYAKNDFCLSRLNKMGINPHVCNAVAAISSSGIGDKVGVFGKMFKRKKDGIVAYEDVVDAADEINDFVNWRDVEEFASSFVEVLKDK